MGSEMCIRDRRCPSRCRGCCRGGGGTRPGGERRVKDEANDERKTSKRPPSSFARLSPSFASEAKDGERRRTTTHSNKAQRFFFFKKGRWKQAPPQARRSEAPVMYASEPVHADDHSPGTTNVLQMPADEISVEQLQAIVSSGANPAQLRTLSHMSCGSDQTQIASATSPTARVPPPPPLPQKYAGPQKSLRHSGMRTPGSSRGTVSLQAPASASAAAHKWSAAVWSAGAPTSVHSSPVLHCTCLLYTSPSPRDS